MGLFRKKTKSTAAKERKEPVLDIAEPVAATAKPAKKKKAKKVRRKKRRRPFIFTLLSWGMTLAMWGLIVMAATTAYVFINLEKKGLFNIPEREPGMMLLARDGTVITERGSFYGDAARIHEMPRYVPLAVVAIEDRRFYKHFGIDPLGIARAFYTNFKAGRVVEGGSTLTQQLAKNLFLKPERTYERKFQEMVLSLWLENKYTKDEILQLYLNRVYFGSGAYGIEQAAQKFFGKSVKDVTISEAAILAAVLKAPSSLNPVKHPKRAAKRANAVINDMIENRFITEEEARRAATVRTRVKSADYKPATEYVADWVEDQVPELIGKFDRSIIVETTIQTGMQVLAERVVRKRLNEQGVSRNVSQAAFVAMTPDGQVLAMVGGRDYVASQFNRAVKAKRQPGSAFKPFVYLTALEQGASPETTEVDGPITIGKWKPENYNRKYRGRVTLKTALALSLNTVAVKVAAAAGPENVVLTAQRLGIRSQLQANASIALGTSEVSLLELTSAFAPFANGGTTIIPHVITRITTRDGKVLFQRQGSGLGSSISEFDLGAMNEMLRTVVNRGTARRARLKNQDVGGKTGTSQDYRDGWFIGYTRHLVAGVWVGNDDNSSTKRVTGGSLPAQIWKDVMSVAHRRLKFAKLPGKRDPYRDGGDYVAEMEDEQGNRRRGGFLDVLETMFGGNRRKASGDTVSNTGRSKPRYTNSQRRKRAERRVQEMNDIR
jgi:penicillin-binding protein 1A